MQVRVTGTFCTKKQRGGGNTQLARLSSETLKIYVEGLSIVMEDKQLMGVLNELMNFAL